MAAISNDWLAPLGGEFKKPYYAQLYEFVKNEYNTKQVFPPADEIFTAFHLTSLSQVKVVIIGQDPYHQPGQAHGLCFSVQKPVPAPPSLVFRNSQAAGSAPMPSRLHRWLPSPDNKDPGGSSCSLDLAYKTQNPFHQAA